MGALGFSCFGPLELRPDAAAYGCMMSTPKVGWSGVNLLAPLRAAFSVPIALDTDVGGAAPESGASAPGRGLSSLAYVTVGTGIGGAVAPGTPAASRLMHAEMRAHPSATASARSRFRGHLPISR